MEPTTGEYRSYVAQTKNILKSKYWGKKLSGNNITNECVSELKLFGFIIFRSLENSGDAPCWLMKPYLACTCKDVVETAI